jgi:hypothetical protein
VSWWSNKKEKKEIPPLSDALREISATTSQVALRQASEFLHTKIDIIPPLSIWHDELIACYICGFVNGMCQHTKADLTWAKGDVGLSDMAAMLCSQIAMVKTIGGERTLICQERIPQMQFRPATGNYATMEMVGGEDGIAAAKAEPLPQGGSLLHFLKNNPVVEE